MRTAHLSVVITKDMFNRGVGFYYAKYPEDYAKIVDKVEPYSTNFAYEARKAVRVWAEGFSDRKVRIDKWNVGWKAGIEIASGKSRGASRERSTVADDRRDVESSQQVDKYRSRAQPVTCNNRERVDEVTAKDTDRDKEKHESKTRANDRWHGKEQETNLSRDKISVNTNVNGDTADARGDNRQDTERSGRERNDVRKESQSEIYYARERDIGDVIENSGDGKHIQKVVNDNRHGQIETPTNKEGEMKRKRENSIEGASYEAKQRRQEDRQDDGFENYNDDIELGEEAEVSSASSSSASSSSSSSSATTQNLDDELRARANKILRRGYMPMCPPARRDWTALEELSLESMGITITWPPENWKSMTADQRLLAHEFISMFLERTRGQGFPLLSRRALLDKYNFMALEGEGKPQEEVDSGDKTDAKIRFYNYSYIRSVARGEVQDTRMSKGIVSSMEGTSRWTDTDHIIDQLDSAGVKLKF